MQILALHDCRFIPLNVAIRFSLSVRSLDLTGQYMDLTRILRQGPYFLKLPGTGWLVSTTKLSQFVTARYAPKKAMQAIWDLYSEKNRRR